MTPPTACGGYSNATRSRDRPCRLFDAEGVDLLGVDADERLAEAGAQFAAAGGDCLGPAPDLEHARGPRIDRHEIVDHDRLPRVGLDVAVLLGGADLTDAKDVPVDVYAEPERRLHHIL